MAKKFTKDEEAALRDCLVRELEKFTTDPTIMPERVKHLTSALAKLQPITEELADDWSYE